MVWRGGTSLFQKNLQNVRSKLLDRGWDYVVCYDGFERVGKSTLAFQAGIEIDPEFARDIECEDYKAALTHSSHSQEDMVRQVRDGTTKSAHHLDEASLLAREAMSPWNVQMMKALSVMGYKHDFISFNFPNFWDLDPYLRDHRCAARILVRSYMGIRGKATLFVARKADFPGIGGRKVWWEEAFDIEFLGFDSWSEPYGEFWARYEELDQKAKEKILIGDFFDWRQTAYKNGKAAGMTDKEIAKVIGISRRHLYTLKSKWA